MEPNQLPDWFLPSGSESLYSKSLNLNYTTQIIAMKLSPKVFTAGLLTLSLASCVEPYGANGYQYQANNNQPNQSARNYQQPSAQQPRNQPKSANVQWNFARSTAQSLKSTLSSMKSHGVLVVREANISATNPSGGALNLRILCWTTGWLRLTYWATRNGNVVNIYSKGRAGS